jgi:hypothetical protein
VKTRASSGHVFWGLVFVTLGTLLLLEQLEVADTADTAGTWWPMIIVALGAWRLSVSGGRNLGALVVLLVGVTLQIDQLEVLDRSVWELAWPVALIVLGLWLLLRRPWARDGWSFDSARTSSDDDLAVLSLMSDATPLLGSVEDKRRHATTTGDVHPPRLRLDATAIMGGVELKDA